MDFKISNFEEFANWIHTERQRKEEILEDYNESERVNRDLRLEIRYLRKQIELLKAQTKKATATNSDRENICIDNIPQIFKGRAGYGR